MGTTWNGHFDWSDENVATLKKLFDEGHSFSVIAKRMGGGLTRNACLGKAHRLGFAQRGRASVPPAPRTVAPRPAKPSPPSKPSAPAARVQREPPPAPAPSPRLGIAGNGHVYTQAPSAPLPRLRVVEPSGNPARIIDPGFGGCRWPIEADPGRGRMDEQRFCCGPREPGKTYCSGHRALAFSKANNPLGPKTDKANDLIRQLRRFA